MSDRIIVMSAGKVQQASSPEQLYNFPVNRFVAEFIGSANLIAGQVDESTRVGSNVEFVLDNGVRICARDERGARSSTPKLLSVRSVYPKLVRGTLDGAAVNTWQCTVTAAVFSGDFIEYRVSSPLGEIVVRLPPTDRYALSDELAMQLDPAHCIVVDH